MNYDTQAAQQPGPLVEAVDTLDKLIQSVAIEQGEVLEGSLAALHGKLMPILRPPAPQTAGSDDRAALEGAKEPSPSRSSLTERIVRLSYRVREISRRQKEIAANIGELTNDIEL